MIFNTPPLPPRSCFPGFSHSFLFSHIPIHRQDHFYYSIHQQQGFTAPTDNPEVKQQIKGLFRAMVEHRPEQVTQSKKKPITINQIRIMDFPKGILGLRDKALLLLGFATGMRRSELAAVRKDHIEETEFAFYFFQLSLTKT